LGHSSYIVGATVKGKLGDH